MDSNTTTASNTKKSRVISYLMDFLKEELGTEKDEAKRKDLENQIQMFRFLPRREFTSEDVVVPSALVSLSLDGRVSDYLIVPSLGGMVTAYEGRPLQVITPKSPLGERLLGHRLHDVVEIEVAGKARRYQIVELR